MSKHLHRTVAGALKDCINAHGPIDKEFIGSAAKRIVNAIEKKLWQNIKTAPKDGSTIWVCGSFEGENKTMDKAFWNGSAWDFSGSCTGETYNPTHWLPLPTMPK